MTLPLTGRRVLIFAGPDYEDLELWYPKLRLEEAGADVVLAGEKGSEKFNGKHGYPCVTDVDVASLKAADFDGVICPGGWMPDKLRRNLKVLELIRETADAGKLVAAICHGGWLCASADVYRGVRITGSPGIKDDMINAGAKWEDASVVVDRHFISSRRPSDLPDFCREIVAFLGRG